MSTTFHAYAASASHAPLEPFSFDPDELGPEEVEIQVSHCGICHSDLSMLDNEWGWSTFPFVPGHEAVGTVVALGQDAMVLRSASALASAGSPIVASSVTSASRATTIAVRAARAPWWAAM